jgi:hypothetical protein
MILIWSGRGYVVPASTFAAALATELLTEAAFRDDRYYQEQAWPLSVALAVGGVVSYLVGRARKQGTGDPFAQPSLGSPARAPARHTFFWVSAEYWGMGLILGAVLNLLLRGL